MAEGPREYWELDLSGCPLGFLDNFSRPASESVHMRVEGLGFRVRKQIKLWPGPVLDCKEYTSTSSAPMMGLGFRGRAWGLGFRV